MKVKITRAFYLKGAVQSGGILEVDDRLARELIAMGKVEAAQDIPAQSGPMTTETVPVLVQGKGKKEKQDAGQ